MNSRNILLTLAAVLICTASMNAQLSHTWVSGSGNDNNNCSFTAPCLTFQNALNSTTFGGIVTAKDAGDFGIVNINQDVTIDGSNLGSITFGGNGAEIVIQDGANVNIRNLTLNSLGSATGGIAISSGGAVTVSNCEIENFIFAGIQFNSAGSLTVENSRFHSFIGVGGVSGIQVNGDGAENLVVRNTIIDASPAVYKNTGIMILDGGNYPVKVALQNVTITGAGIAGIYAQSGVTEITSSVLTQSNTAVSAVNGATISVASSLITANNTGVCSKSKIRLDNNDIYDNTTAIANCDGIVKTSTTNKTSGTIAILAADVSDSVTF